MISIVDRKQTANGTLKKYVADTYSEMENADDKVAGDIAYCIETKKWYMLSDSLIWTIILNDMSADLTSLWNAINDKQDSLTFDSTPTNDSSNPVTSEGIKSALLTKAPNSHASSGTTYGVGTTANYGHNKVINDLTHSSFANGESLSAYQGKVLNDRINTKQNKLTFDTTPTNNSTNPVTSSGIKSAINNKQNKLTFDTTPTNNSTNPVTSSGIKSAISEAIKNKQNKLTFDSIPTAGSSNPVTSEGIKLAIASGGVTVDSAMSTTSVNPVQNKVITAYVAPKSHASSGTTYGVGTTANYGHNKVINDLTHSAFANGESLSAYQGYLLQTNKQNNLNLGSGWTTALQAALTATIAELNYCDGVTSAIQGQLNTKLGVSAYSAGSVGYIHFSNGFKIQWGVTGSTTDLNPTTVSFFPLSFSNTNYSFNAQQYNGVEGKYSNGSNTKNAAPGSIVLVNRTGGRCVFKWIAIGY